MVKTCAYCGRSSEESAVNCRECGTEFSTVEGTVEAVEAGQEIDFIPLKSEDANHTWVTLMRCRNVVEADLIAMQLDAADIPVFVPDEFVLQALSINANAFGYVRVQVPPGKYEMAREVLSARATSEGNTDSMR